MADYTIKQNDTSKKIEATLKDVAGVAVNLTGATVVFSMWLKRSRTLKVDEASATIVVAASGTVEYQWVAADTDTAGDYEGEFEVTFSGGLIETFPNDRNIQIAVAPEIS